MSSHHQINFLQLVAGYKHSIPLHASCIFLQQSQLQSLVTTSEIILFDVSRHDNFAKLNHTCTSLMGLIPASLVRQSTTYVFVLKLTREVIPIYSGCSTCSSFPQEENALHFSMQRTSFEYA